MEENKELRECGFYWIQKNDGDWEIAMYGTTWGPISGWWEIGKTAMFTDNDIEKIGAMVERT